MTLQDLLRALADRRVADWVVTTRDQDSATVDEAGPLRRHESRTRWTLVVHDDGATGRGSARVELDGHDGPASVLVDQALSLARASVGVAWRMRPAAAPARVELRDANLDLPDLAVAAATNLRAIPRDPRARVTAGATVLRERVAMQSRQGLRASWLATHVRADLIVTVGDHSLRLSREARLAGKLELADAVTAAIADLTARATAGAPPTGPCDVLLGPDALLHGGGYGMWAAFASQADAIVERQGLTRYREGHPVAETAETVADPLTISSDGALDHGVLSAQVSDEGDAIRAFTIVERGVASGLGLSPREAAIRDREPNGGVRNLVVSTGAATAGELPADGPRLVEIRRLRSLAIDPFTGAASMEIALGIDHRGGVARAFAGGALRVDLIHALSHARRDRVALERGPYVGPRAVIVDDVELV